MQQYPDTWRSRDYPVLYAVAGKLEETSKGIYVPNLADDLGMDLADLFRAVRALRGRFLEVKWTENPYGTDEVWVLDITEDARRAVGLWPSAERVTDEIVAALDQRIAETSDPEKRSRWKQVRDAIGGATRDLAVDVIGSIVAKSITGG